LALAVKAVELLECISSNKTTAPGFTCKRTEKETPFLLRLAIKCVKKKTVNSKNILFPTLNSDKESKQLIVIAGKLL
jgi:hypothetical protein